MKFINDFFATLGFDFKRDLKSKKIYLDENLEFSQKLEKSIFYYESPSQTKTSFYVIALQLIEGELEILRKYIWNEDKADLYFTIQSSDLTNLFDNGYTLKLYYAKSSPKDKLNDTTIDIFSGNLKDNSRLSKISKWHFDSGAFWLNYRHFLEKVKLSKSIDKELVNTLNSLKQQLLLEVNNEEIVQALIDRTLYIKYLEDNHIINSYFYKFYFKNENINYKELLVKNKTKDLNALFAIIHEIFNNSLFSKPKIDSQFLTNNVCNLLYLSISGTDLNSRQLSLFDFKFNILPVEFISYIYEIFLSDRQKESGIYYTPKKLAQLIIDDVIPQNKIGKVLDPSCGSGMFLIVAYQKLLENSVTKKYKNIADQIEYRIELLTNNIFGIEKETIAQRFTLFSLSLQIFRDLNPQKIKEYIAEQLDKFGKVDLFKKFSFFDNILCSNSLSLYNKPFDGVTFDYIVGNPPFVEIKQTDEEISFLNNYTAVVNKNEIKAKNIIGKHQISQCFLLKIKDWSSQNTRFGFISNNSTFYNDNSKKFQTFFYENYRIEKIYELSKVKKILFENANESVNALIFNNGPIKNNFVDYYPIELGLFSEKPFELLVIQEDKVLQLSQEDILHNKIRLRDFLVGNEFDIKLMNQLEKLHKLDELLLTLDGTNDTINNGLQIVGKEQLLEEFNISENKWSKLTKTEKANYSNSFKEKYTRKKKDSTYKIPLIQPKNLLNFVFSKPDVYLGSISNFQRIRNPIIYTKPKILINRTGKDLKAVYCEQKVYYNFDIYSIFLKDNKLNYLIVAIINSNLINYFVNFFYRKRIDGSYPKIGYDAIKNIPIPKNLDNNLLKEISKISKNITEGKYSYEGEIAEKLNGLIFDLYAISFLDKQRIKDYFIVKQKVTNTHLELYKEVLKDTIEIYFKTPIEVNAYQSQFNLVVVKINLVQKTQKPTPKKISQYVLNEIFEQNPTENYLASQEKIFGKDCIYIIKKDENINWTETRAYEDGQEILKRID